MKKTYLLFFLLSSLTYSQFTIHKGLKYIEQKKYEYAKTTFEWLIKENPKNYEAINKLAEVSFVLQEWDVAIKCGKTLVQAFPKNAEYWFKYGGALGMKAKSINKLKAITMINDIKNAFETASRLDSKHINARWALVMFYLELPSIVGGSKEKALKNANELLEISKIDGFLAKGYIELINKEYEKAEFYYRKGYEIGQSKITHDKLTELYAKVLKDRIKQ